MTAVLNVFLLVIGFIFLLKGADLLVDGAVGIAKKFNIPTLVIGMTIVAFGTSAPEAAVSITASLEGNNAISFSNVVGSNFFNLLMVGGICAIIRPLQIQKIAVTRDYPFHLLITAALLILCLDTVLGGGDTLLLSCGDGIILLLLMCIFMYMNIKDGMNNPEEVDDDAKKPSLIKNIALFIIGLAGVILGGNFVVDSGTAIAKLLGVSDTLIGLTIVAIGTSLPELVTSVVAGKKGEVDIAWGNIVGSNVFNILFVLGISSLLNAFIVDMQSIYDTVILLVVSTLVYLATAKSKRINRHVGAVMVLIYIIYTAYIIMR